jgi:hypothetical protein
LKKTGVEIIMLTMFKQCVCIKQEDKQHEPLKRVYSFSPITNNSGDYVKPGFYSFVQFNTEDKLLYLVPLKKGASSRAFLTTLALKVNPKALKKNGLLSTGEIIIGEKNAISAWCLKSEASNDKNFLKKTGLPSKALYSIKMWEDLFMPYFIDEDDLKNQIKIQPCNSSSNVFA